MIVYIIVYTNNCIYDYIYLNYLTETLIALILKVDNPMRFGEFRPISMCNVVSKLITKVLINRLKPFPNEIIGSL